jgi:hypothetical protein
VSSASHSHDPSELAALDQLTGGVFSSANAAERAVRTQAWLTQTPGEPDLQRVYRELATKDKGSARLVRERLDELKRQHQQTELAETWSIKAQQLLSAPRLNVADALAWQRDAAKVGAPLSREPLLQYKNQLSDKVHKLEALQHQVQVQREAAVLLAQRIELMSTKSWLEAEAAESGLAQDVASWGAVSEQLMANPDWDSLDVRIAPQLEGSRAQLAVVWEAYRAAVAQGRLAAQDAQVPLPDVPVWAESLRLMHGERASALPIGGSIAGSGASHEERAQAEAAVLQAQNRLEQEISQGHGKASASAAQELRTALKTHGRWLSAERDRQAHAALAAAGELEGWQRWRADQLREQLVSKAEGLLQRPAGQAMGGKKLQEALRELRAQWKETDQGGAPNQTLWRRFDEACNAAHKVVEEWLQKLKAESAEHRAKRLALVDELKAWAATQSTDGKKPTPGAQDWRAAQRALHQFSERWREAGHLSDKAYAELQPQWKTAWTQACAPLDAAQKHSVQQRQAMIEEAVQLGESPTLRIDAIKALQQRWQAEAHAVPLERRHEQKLWEAFRKPIDAAFARKSAARENAAAALSAHDQQVMEAARALEAANAGGQAAAIRTAMEALERALRAAPAAQGAAEPLTANAPVENAQPSGEAPVPTPVAPRKPVVAVRGDDRPGARRAEPAAVPERKGRPTRDDRSSARTGDRRPDRGERDGRGERFERVERARVGDAAFRAQRDAMDHAQAALRKLAAQAHGEALTQLLTAWEQRDAKHVPPSAELGSIAPAVRTQWTQALSQAPQPVAHADASEAVLRLEVAAEVPTPAEHLDARRAFQLKLLTQRNAAAPAQTWGQDLARVFASAHDAATARRVTAALKALLRR